MKPVLIRKSPLLCLSLASAGLLLPAGNLLAQFAGPGQVFSAEVSHSGEAEVGRLGASTETAATYSKLSYSFAAPLSQDSLWSLGLGWKDIRFSMEEPNPLATELQELELTLGGSHRLDRQWTLFGRAGAGWANAGASLGSGGFRPTALAGASYAASQELQWTFGLSYDPFSRYQVLPLLGFNWRFSPGWSASLGLPQTGLGYAWSDSLQLKALFSVEGGSFHVERTADYAVIQAVLPDGSIPLPANGMKDTELDYRELRAGLAAEWSPFKGLSLSVEGGLMLNRKWSFHEHDLNYSGKGTAYGRLALRHRF